MSLPPGWQHNALMAVCLSVLCLILNWERNGVRSWKLAGSPWHGWPVTPFTGWKVKGQGHEADWCSDHTPYAYHTTWYADGVQYNYPHHQHVWWPERSKVRLTRQHNAVTDNQLYLRKGNFKLGTWMEYNDLHQWHAWWPLSWQLWVAVQVTTCRGRGHIVGPHYSLLQLLQFQFCLNRFFLELN